MSETKVQTDEEKMAGLQLRAGDIVRLKSGGPMMTVSFIDPDYWRVECSWFARSSRMGASFQAVELTRVEDDYFYATWQARKGLAEPTVMAAAERRVETYLAKVQNKANELAEPSEEEALAQ